MKKLFAFLLSVAMLTAFTVLPSKHSDAQIVKTYSVVGKTKTDTLGSSADTATVSLSFDGSFKSLWLYGLKISGTASAKAYFEAKTPDGNTWEKLDSLTVGNTSGHQYQKITIPNPRLHAAYRVSWYNANGGTIRAKVYAMRYTGG